MRSHFIKLTALALALALTNCNTDSKKELKRSCIEVSVVKGGELAITDTCFTAFNDDSLNRLVTNYRQLQKELTESFDTQLLFVIVDTLGKEPEDYEYAFVSSEAGIINPDVVFTKNVEFVKEKMKTVKEANLIPKKLQAGETLKRTVEIIFETNIRINWRRVENNTVVN